MAFVSASFFFVHSFQHSFVSYSVHFTCSILLHVHISNASIRFLHFVVRYAVKPEQAYAYLELKKKKKKKKKKKRRRK
ncbi:hypothetical protein ANN_01316 [Periplaneta americana]|uniref:Secreted protein n=1 Tax=Periplaneta americana TaxID=6978 RepID=A0ABQ8TTB4_PERAM|nr:hypothetical protein ANN_01316 [Periplaneta americana]